MPTGEPETLTPRQRQTFNARAALARKFESPEQKREYYRAIGRKSADGRVVLRPAEAAALRKAYALLRSITKLHDGEIGGAS